MGRASPSWTLPRYGWRVVLRLGMLLPAMALVACQTATPGTGPDAPTELVESPQSPYPGGTSTPRPVAQPATTPTPDTLTRDLLAALPSGASMVADLARWSGRPAEPANGDREIWSLAYQVDGRSSVAFVDRAADPPALLWDLADHGGPIAGSRAPFVTTVVAMPEQASRPGVVVPAGDAEALLLLLESDEGGYRITEALPFGAWPDDDSRYEVSFDNRDLTGDGRPDPVLHLPHEDATVFFQRVGDRLGQVARLKPPYQVVDIDADGAFELLTPSGTDRWLMSRWEGDGYGRSVPIVEAPAPAPTAVTDGQLPPLPADLVFDREGAIYRWPREGGAIEAMWEAEPGMELFQPFASWENPPSWRLSADGSRLIALERTDATHPEAAARAPRLRFSVLDLDSGTRVAVPFAGALRGEDSWDISADGSRVVFLVHGTRDGFPVPVEPGAHHGSMPATIYGIDTDRSGQPVVLGTCDTFQAEPVEEHMLNGCRGLKLSPDGRSLSYSDGQGLSLMDLPETLEAETSPPSRLLQSHFYGPREAQITIYRPQSFAPDGRSLTVMLQGYEGGSYGVLDLPTGGAFAIPRSDVHQTGSALAWDDRGRVLNARRGDRNILDRFDLSAPEAERLESLLPVRQLLPGYYNASAPHPMPDGSVRFLLRTALEGVYRGNGAFSVDPETGAWRRLVALPALPTNSDGWTSVAWSPDGLAFVEAVPSPRTDGVEAVRVGLADQEILLDATSLLGEAKSLAWRGD